MDASGTNVAPHIEIERTTLLQLVVKLLQRKGMFVAEAEIVAERMIEANLEARPGDGVGTLPQYLEAMDLGDIDPRARIITISETPAVAILDGSSGFGHVATTRAMQTAIEKGRAVGTGMVVVKNSRPGGDLGTVSRIAANEGMIGMVTTSFDEPGENPHDHKVAWSIPGPAELPPITRRESAAALGLTVELFALMSTGLACAAMGPRKPKGLRPANHVEYCVLAIDPATFGPRDALLEKWRPLWSADAPGPSPTADANVRLSTGDAEVLAELAAKIKFPITWETR